ncbi:hypothetical protein [Marinospirillum celere]|uniref:hypothetical protein n=1 Tax=Marinospirillum celere TaxID=1122252 RepID=UPI0015A5B418|nr:hypothetical protein [Marinospirillum celere]
MSRPSYVATAGGFCMAGSSRPAVPVATAEAASNPVAGTAKPDPTLKPGSKTTQIIK